ncbi:hypothetical protein TH25_23320 [Thalassospira profundimaris]|uniref:Uncharacterized protein n=1 Tax=Thalassospira profundimaris TaxID=502049 RepID=A0A367WL38_9PROT|nr:hypothetical protein TH25_23320 [Thalassospira profundimaris]
MDVLFAFVFVVACILYHVSDRAGGIIGRMMFLGPEGRDRPVNRAIMQTIAFMMGKHGEKMPD